VANFGFSIDTASAWASNNPTPNADEACFESDTKLIKIGDGTTAYKTLPPLNGPAKDYLAPIGFDYATMGRNSSINSTLTLTSGTLYLAGIALPAGYTVGHIAFGFSSTVTVPTHSWYGLYDSSRVQLAMTADQLTATINAGMKSLAISTTAAGSASSFTTTYTGLYYLGVMTVQTSAAIFGLSIGANTVLYSASPALCGSSDTGQTTVPAFPHTAAAVTALNPYPYGVVGA
jgi:hypothetical protein